MTRYSFERVVALFPTLERLYHRVVCRTSGRNAIILFTAVALVVSWSVSTHRPQWLHAAGPLAFPTLYASTHLSMTNPEVPTVTPAPVTPLPAHRQVHGWFSDIVGKSVVEAIDEPDLHRMPVKQAQTIVRAAHAASRRPVAVTFFTPKCAFDRRYLNGVDIMIDDFYPAFAWMRTNVVRLARQQIDACAAFARSEHVQYWLNLQAFGPGVTGYGPFDRWRCLAPKEMNAILALTKRPDVKGVIFWDRKNVCPALVPTIKRTIRS